MYERKSDKMTLEGKYTTFMQLQKYKNTNIITSSSHQNQGTLYSFYCTTAYRGLAGDKARLCRQAQRCRTLHCHPPTYSLRTLVSCNQNTIRPRRKTSKRVAMIKKCEATYLPHAVCCSHLLCQTWAYWCRIWACWCCCRRPCLFLPHDPGRH
jgi:hypothetical protein